MSSRLASDGKTLVDCSPIWSRVMSDYSSSSNQASAPTLRTVGEAKVIDLRSDTVTKPSLEMRHAMATAEVGDDVYGEDPTVNELQRRCAGLLGKEAALFVPSGTMANLLAVLVHCQRRGMELIAGDTSHILLFEQGGMSQFGGVMCRTIRNLPDGTFDLKELRGLLRPRNDDHQPWSRLICVENPHCSAGGKVMPQEFLKEVFGFATNNGLVVHMDGARLANAAVALGTSMSALTACCHSVSLCFSKGLSAPVGAILAGPEDFIAMARRLRKAVGGGMRQAGVLAAACIYSLDHVMPQLQQDHQHAQTIARALNRMSSGVLSKVDLDGVHTNLFRAQVEKPGLTAEAFCRRMEEVREEEVRAVGAAVSVKMLSSNATNKVRIVTHSDVGSEDVELAIRKFQYVIDMMSPETVPVNNTSSES